MHNGICNKFAFLTCYHSKNIKNVCGVLTFLESYSGMRLDFGKNSGKFYVAIDSNPIQPIQVGVVDDKRGGWWE